MNEDVIARAREAITEDPHAYDPEQLTAQIASLKRHLAEVLRIIDGPAC